MAKTVGSINEAAQDLKDRYKVALRTAVNKGVDMGVKDIYQFAISCIDQYYANYEPSIYDRTYQLYDTVSSIAEIADGGDVIAATVGVRFDAGALGTHYHQTFWGTETGVENGYSENILSDFLDGIHPMTDGSPEPGTPALIIQDGRSTDGLLNRYLPMYLRKLERIIDGYLKLSI